jgi:hypothetical protein
MVGGLWESDESELHLFKIKVRTLKSSSTSKPAVMSLPLADNCCAGSVKKIRRA